MCEFCPDGNGGGGDGIDDQETQPKTSINNPNFAGFFSTEAIAAAVRLANEQGIDFSNIDNDSGSESGSSRNIDYGAVDLDHDASDDDDNDDDDEIDDGKENDDDGG